MKKQKATKDGDRMVVHEAIGRVGIKVAVRQRERKKGGPMQKS
jgi:hypothetical protein